MKKLCSKLSVADCRLAVLDSEYHVTISKSVDDTNAQKCSPDDAISLTLEDIIDTYGKPVFISYFLVAPAASAPPPRVSAFDRMMAASKELHLPDAPTRGINKKLDLKADVLEWLKKENVGWRTEQLESHGAPFVTLLCDVLWYVDPHQSTMKARGCGVPELLVQFMGYNQPAKHGHSVQPLSRSTLDGFKGRIEQCCLQLWIQKAAFKFLNDAVTGLLESLERYSAYLEKQVKSTVSNQAKLQPVRTTDDACMTVLIQPTPAVLPKHVATYTSLLDKLRSAALYEPVCVNDFEGSAGVSVFTYRRHLAEVMPFPVRKFLFSSGNNRGDYMFLWKVDSAITADEELLNSNKSISEVKKNLQVYHTRAMRRQFAGKAGRICNLKPAQIRAVYRELTGM